MIKLAAFDVDGTLRDRQYLPQSTREALRKLKESGVTLALCTGRSEHEMSYLREELDIDWALTCNGSHIGYSGRTVFGNAFPAETIQHWLREGERLNHTLLLYGSRRMYINRPDCPRFRQADREIGFMEPDLIRDYADVPEIYQGIIFCGEEDESYYTGHARESFYVHRWRTWAVDFNPNGMNKAKGLRKLMMHLKLSPDEVAAFGDGLNDVEMIQSVGLGIVMGNADEALKSKAKAAHVTKRLDEDGIAYAVDRWLLKA